MNRQFVRRSVKLARFSTTAGTFPQKSFVKTPKAVNDYKETARKNTFGVIDETTGRRLPLMDAASSVSTATGCLDNSEAAAKAAKLNLKEFYARICVIGVGGGGCNAVNNMISNGLNGVDFISCNTDAQHLSSTLPEKKIQLGRLTTEGLGCGAEPATGIAAAQESREEIIQMIGDAHLVFITAGMGGGTGTGAAQVIAEICQELKVLTVGVVTKPFAFEGRHRMRLANEGIRALQDRVDTLIVIPNQNLFSVVDKNTTFLEAFKLADDILLSGVQSITDLILKPGLINLDFADVRAVISRMGNALMGTGQAEGEDRAIRAAEDALLNPLLGTEGSVRSAKGMLVNITGGSDLTLFEVDRAAQHICSAVDDEDANIIFGSCYDSTMEGSIRVSVVATGFENNSL